MLVFNYGSNLSKEQFARRCPTARLVGVARIRDMRLTFAGWSHGRAGSVATIVPAEGKMALGAVYELRSPEDVRRLDSAEGFPSCYGCEEFTAEVKLDGRYRKRSVWAYVKVDDREGQPSNSYLKTVAQGYKDHGLKMSFLADAVAALPARSLKPKLKVRPMRPPSRGRGGPVGTEFSWDTGRWEPAKKKPAKPPKRREGKKPRHPKKGKKKKAQVVYVRSCSEPNCHEDLTNPCSYCPVDAAWHCAHCCPKAAPWLGTFY